MINATYREEPDSIDDYADNFVKPLKSLLVVDGGVPIVKTNLRFISGCSFSEHFRIYLYHVLAAGMACYRMFSWSRQVSKTRRSHVRLLVIPRYFLRWSQMLQEVEGIDQAEKEIHLHR
jgi:hypothetical protein